MRRAPFNAATARFHCARRSTAICCDLAACERIVALCAACFLTAAVFAADAATASTPAGTWKWTPPGRNGAAGVERTLKLDYADGKLTGTLLGAKMGQFDIPDTAISDASFKDGAIAFSVTSEMNGNKRTAKYTGTLDGDSIKGSSEAPGRDGNVMKREWNPVRAK